MLRRLERVAEDAGQITEEAGTEATAMMRGYVMLRHCGKVSGRLTGTCLRTSTDGIRILERAVTDAVRNDFAVARR